MSESVEEIVLERAEWILQQLKETFEKKEINSALRWHSDLSGLRYVSLQLSNNNHISKEAFDIIREKSEEGYNIIFGQDL